MGLTAEEMGRITQAWPDRLASWQATVANDENEYDFDDSEYAKFKAEGEEAAKKATGHDGKTGGQITGGSMHAAAGATGAGLAVAHGGLKAATGNIKRLGSKIAGKSGEKTASSGTKSWSAYAAAALAIATALAYWITKPNKDEKKACDALQTEMTGAQSELSSQQNNMSTISGEIMELSDEALALNEDTNEKIKDKKSEYDAYFKTFMAIKAKIDAGEQISDSEKELYKTVVGYLNEIGVNIEELGDESSDEVASLYDDIGTYQENYDNVAESMGEIEGLTDFAEGIDEATRTMCYVEGTAQGLNAISGAVAGARLMATGFWNWALGIASIVAGASSGVAAFQQFKMAGEVGTEIEMRKGTQDLNTETLDIYTEEIDAYDGFLQGVEDLELEIPDDIAPPENTELPVNAGEATGEEAVPEVLKPKKEEQDKKA